MDPSTNQPQVNPQVPPQTPPPAPAANTAPIVNQPPNTVPPRPAQATPVMDSFSRPVAPWPANPQQAQNAAATNPAAEFSPQVAQTVGHETSEAAGAIPNLGSSGDPVTTPTTTDSFLDEPAATPPESEPPVMTDTQAKDLFKEEDATKKHFKSIKIKKALKVFLGLIILTLIIGGVYIFWFGTKAAQSYKNSSSISSYKDAFTEITDSIAQQPMDSAKLESGLNKLKIAEDNNTKLNSIILGDLNPNYKKVKKLSSTVAAYKEGTKSYKDKFSYPTYIASIASANGVVDDLQKLGGINVQAVNSEDVLKDVKELTDKCTKAITGIKDSPKPADMSTPTDTYHKALTDICIPLLGTIETTLTGKTGIMTPEDQTKVKEILSGVANSASSFVNGSGSASFDINQLSAYLREAHDEADKLKQAAEAILKG